MARKTFLNKEFDIRDSKVKVTDIRVYGVDNRLSLKHRRKAILKELLLFPEFRSMMKAKEKLSYLIPSSS
jgi:hypothetical protein